MKNPVGMVLVLGFLMMAKPLSIITDARGLASIPKVAMITLRLANAPGLSLSASKWEVAYEFRIIAESNLWNERAKLKEGSTQRAGDLIKQGTLAKSLGSPHGQTLLIKIPFPPATLEKLENQPKDRQVPGQDTHSQVFLFYAVFTIRDAKLNKTITVPVLRQWDYANFPQARFEIEIAVNNDGGYSVNSSHTKSPKNGITIVK
jgi:hypothetical protein